MCWLAGWTDLLSLAQVSWPVELSNGSGSDCALSFFSFLSWFWFCWCCSWSDYSLICCTVCAQQNRTLPLPSSLPLWSRLRHRKSTLHFVCLRCRCRRRFRVEFAFCPVLFPLSSTRIMWLGVLSLFSAVVLSSTQTRTSTPPDHSLSVDDSKLLYRLFR